VGKVWFVFIHLLKMNTLPPVTAAVKAEREEKMIDMIRDRPCLYDKTVKEYKDRTNIDNAWQSISDTLQPKLTGLLKNHS